SRPTPRPMPRRTRRGRSARSLATRHPEPGAGGRASRSPAPIRRAAPMGRNPAEASDMSLSADLSLKAAEPVEAVLSVNNIEVIYDRVILVLKGVSLTVPAGGIVAILGANGAGKTTTLKAISNLLHAERGEVTKGSIE